MFHNPSSSGPVAGRIAWQEDEYGNRQTFVYRTLGATTPKSRLHRIYLNGTDQTDSQGFIEFGYYISPTGSSPPAPAAVHGRVARVRAYRMQDSTPVLVHRLEYTYKRDSDGLSPSLGTPGDLIQVTKYSAVERATSNQIPGTSLNLGLNQERISIQQYRYHSGDAVGESADERLMVSGPQHALKSVIRSEQIEAYAAIFNRDNPWTAGRPYGLRDAAFRLMVLPDHGFAMAPNCGERYQVVDLASEIVGYLGTDAGDTVSTQYVQPCGCACGGASQTVKFEYSEPIEWSGGNGISVRIDQYTRPSATGSWSLHLTRFVDSQRIGSSNAFYGVNDVIQNPANTSQMWIRHFEYDTTTRNLLQEWSPANCKEIDYEPATISSATNLVHGTTLSPEGAVRTYEYTNRRLSGVGYRTGSTFTPTARITFGSGSGDTRVHLPINIKRFPTTDTSPGEDDIETTTFEYTFWSGGSFGGSAVQSVRASVEAELQSENGPTSSTAVTYSSIGLFDQRGRQLGRGAADGRLTRSEFDARTGATTKVVLNADWEDLPDELETVYGDWLGDMGLSSTHDGQTLAYEMERDPQGRILSISAPGPAGAGTVTDQWVYGFGPIDKSSRNEYWGGVFAYYIHLPASWMDGETRRFAGPASIVWTNSRGSPIQIGRFRINPEADYDRDHIDDLIAAQTDSNIEEESRSELFRTIMRRSPFGALTEYEVWNDVVGCLGRPDGQQSYLTVLEYDHLGRIKQQTTPDGEITSLERDRLGRVTEVHRGTSATNLKQVAEYYYDADPGATTLASGVGNGLLNIIEELTGEDSGNDRRRTIFHFNERNQLDSVTNPLPPHQFIERDNLGRVVASGDFTSSAAPTAMTHTDRGRYIEHFYSQRGLRYRTRVAIDPASDDPDFIESHTWFDGRGRVVASWGPDSPAVKRTFDPLGRIDVEYVTDRHDDPLPGATDNWDAATSIVDDTVLEQTMYEYADFGPASFIRHLTRRHDAVDTGSPPEPIRGELTLGTSATGIATYTGFTYDAVGRLSRQVEFGTNRAPGTGRVDDAFGNGTDPSTGSSPVWPLPDGPTAAPEWNDTGYANHLVTAWQYNERGLLDSIVDPKGRRSRVVYDDEEDPIATIESAVSTSLSIAWDTDKGRWGVSGYAGGSTPLDQDRVTSVAELKLTEPARWVHRRAAHFPPVEGVSAQVTEVVYGITAGTGAGDSLINTMWLPKEVRYPDKDSGEPGSATTDIVKYAYNRLGELRAAIDRNGTAHAYLRDELGRVTGDGADAASGVDDAIDAITAEFDALGRVKDVRSKSGSTVKNHVRYGYDDAKLGLLSSITQDVDSDIDTTSGESSRVVGYDHVVHAIDTTESGAIPNSARVARMRYPSLPGVASTLETRLAFQYGVDGDAMQPVHAAITRVSALALESWNGSEWKAGDPPIAEYTSLGLGAHSHIELAMAGDGVLLDRTLDRTGRRTSTDTNTVQDSGVYPGFDRFGRLKRHAWVLAGSKRSTATDLPDLRELVNFSYFTDKVGNITHKRDDRQGDSFMVAGPGSTTVERWPDRDWVYSYDGLDRLVQAARGVIGQDDPTGANGSFTSATPPGLTLSKGSQKWHLDQLGNWTGFAIDFDNNSTTAGVPSFDDGGGGGSDESELQKRGAHNQQNHLPSLPELPDAPEAATGSPYAAAGVTIGYDANGNRVSSGWDGATTDTTNNGDTVRGFRFKYVYDAWNRLVRIERAKKTDGGVGSYVAFARYGYNGLSQRISKESVGRTLGDTDTIPTTLPERRYYYYDAAWRAIVEEIDDDVGSTAPGTVNGLTTVPGTDRVAQQFFGLRGLNDAVFRREDRTTPAIAAIEDDPETTEVNEEQAAVPAAGPNGDFEGGHDIRFYQLSDHQLSIVRVLLDVDRTFWYPGNDVEYDPYGNPRRTATADFNRSGGIAIQDLFDFLSAYFVPHLAADLNGTGAVSLQDLNDFLSEYYGADSTPRDRISGRVLGTLIDNPYGYCGYHFDQETAAAKVLGPGGGGLYQCRHRVYDPIAGRWLTEDPAGFVDGSNLYEYCGGDSINCFDPLGLEGHPGATFTIGACQPDEGGAATQHSHAAGAPTGTAEEQLERLKQNFLKVVDQKVQNGQISASEGDRARKGANRTGSFWEGAHDGALAWSEGAINTALSSFAPDPVTQAAFRYLGLPDQSFTLSVDFSDAMYDPDDPNLAWSRRMGTVSFMAASGAAGMSGAAGKAATSLSKLTGRGRMGRAPNCAAKNTCFVAGTLVWTASGLIPIEDLRIGDRVLTGISDEDGEREQPAELWALRLTMSNPEAPDDLIEIELLRSPEWVKQHEAFQGCTIGLLLHEVGVQGPALVESLDECPPLNPGLGRLVLATITHLNGAVLTIRLDGTDQVIEPTASHLIYSEDREDWVPAGELRVGEHLRTTTGLVAIIGIDSKSGVCRVYNLEVETDHVYFVSPMGVLVHNDCPAIARDPNTIRFSQDSISASFRNPAYGKINDLRDGLKSRNIKPESVEPIRLVERKGHLISIDNRRLEAFRRAGMDVPTRMATRAEIRQAKQQGKFSAGKLGGITIKVRGE
ncbi:MAG: hypothetical protein IT438_15050 [Phycisphaerales bacterium]|nr:hypothetical protein [Phycisphaerales bacterium]